MKSLSVIMSALVSLGAIGVAEAQGIEWGGPTWPGKVEVRQPGGEWTVPDWSPAAVAAAALLAVGGG